MTATLRNDYEWTLERTDEYGDIVESDFDDDVAALLSRNCYIIMEGNWHLALVCDRCEYFDGEWNGVVDRNWAYYHGGELPEVATGGMVDHKVPKRFHQQLNKVPETLLQRVATADC